MTMIDVTHDVDTYDADFASLCDTAPPSRAWLQPLRERAFEAFRDAGFPTRHDEAWRFTNIAALATTPHRLAGPDGVRVDEGRLRRFSINADGPRLVFVNGHFATEHSCLEGTEGVCIGVLGDGTLPQEIVESNLARHARIEGHALCALNTAFMETAAIVVVPKGVVIEQPIEIIWIAASQGKEPTVTHPRALVVAGPESQVTVLETYLGQVPTISFTNAVTEIIAEEGAVVEHYKVVREGAQTHHLATTHLHQSRDASITSHTCTLDGRLVRTDLTAVLAGEGACSTLNGFSLVAGTQHVDNHLQIEHDEPHGDSREYFKSILDDQASAVFTGKIIVAQDAQKTDAKQTNMNLLLSADAHVNTRPQLEIFADDVKCTHGATIGQLDADALFYLRSRGMDMAAARDVLVYAFAVEVLERVKIDRLRRQLQETVLERLPCGEMLREFVED